MNIAEKKYKDFAIVYMYDPINLEKTNLDKLKEKLFPRIFSDSESNLCLLEDTQRKLRVQLQSTRLEYIDNNETEFTKRDIDSLTILLDALPQMSIRALGLNFSIEIKVTDYIHAGEYIRDTFLKDTAQLENKFDQKIICASTRMILGAPGDHLDVRITPSDITSDKILCQVHYHKEAHIVDPSKVFNDTKELYLKWSKDIDSILNNL